MGKVLQEKIAVNYRNAGIGERKRGETCGNCVRVLAVDFKGIGKRLRCEKIGGVDKDNRRFDISPVFTCDGQEKREERRK